jgi:hypothetical protein
VCAYWWSLLAGQYHLHLTQIETRENRTSGDSATHVLWSGRARTGVHSIGYDGLPDGELPKNDALDWVRIEIRGREVFVFHDVAKHVVSTHIVSLRFGAAQTLAVALTGKHLALHLFRPTPTLGVFDNIILHVNSSVDKLPFWSHHLAVLKAAAAR